MDASVVGLISGISVVAGASIQGIFNYFGTKKKSEDDSGVGYADAILGSHEAIWNAVSEMRKELGEERSLNTELSSQLKKSLEAMKEVLEEKRKMVEQMVTLNEEVSKLQEENKILQEKVDHLTSELSRYQNKEE